MSQTLKTSISQLNASKKYYAKNKDAKKIIMNKYYRDNADLLKAKRRERYRAQKEQKAKAKLEAETKSI